MRSPSGGGICKGAKECLRCDLSCNGARDGADAVFVSSLFHMERACAGALVGERSIEGGVVPPKWNIGGCAGGFGDVAESGCCSGSVLMTVVSEGSGAGAAGVVVVFEVDDLFGVRFGVCAFPPPFAPPPAAEPVTAAAPPFFFADATGNERPRSLPRLATPTPQVNCVL